MKLEDDLESLWAKAKAQGLTYARAAELLELRWLGKWGTSTVRDAVQGRGGEARENQLRVTLKEFLGGAVSAIDGRTESANPGVDQLVDRPDNISLEQWRRRAMVAEEKLKGLQTNLRAALAYSEAPVPPVSSKPASAAARYGAKGAASTGSDPAK